MSKTYVVFTISILVAIICFAEYRDSQGERLTIAADGSTNITKVLTRTYISTYSNAVLDNSRLDPGGNVVWTSIEPNTNNVKVRYVADITSVTPASSDAANKHTTMLTLANNSDLIAIGTVERGLHSPGWRPFYIHGEEILLIYVFKIEEIVGSVVDSVSGTNGIISTHGCSNIVYILIHNSYLATTSGGCKGGIQGNDPILCIGGRYLVWLKQYALDVSDASRYDLEGQSMFKAVLGQRGVVLLSVEEELPGVKYHPEYLSVYGNPSKMLLEMYNTTDTEKIVKATRHLLKSMHVDTDDEGRNKETKQWAETLGISASNAVESIEWGRLRTVEKRLP